MEQHNDAVEPPQQRDAAWCRPCGEDARARERHKHGGSNGDEGYVDIVERRRCRCRCGCGCGWGWDGECSVTQHAVVPQGRTFRQRHHHHKNGPVPAWRPKTNKRQNKRGRQSMSAPLEAPLASKIVSSAVLSQARVGVSHRTPAIPHNNTSHTPVSYTNNVHKCSASQAHSFTMLQRRVQKLLQEGRPTRYPVPYTVRRPTLGTCAEGPAGQSLCHLGHGSVQ